MSAGDPPLQPLPMSEEFQSYIEDSARSALKAIAPNGPSGLPPGAETWAIMVGMREVAKATRAVDRLRAQRKRHAQRFAALSEELWATQTRLANAMEIVRYVAGFDWDRVLNVWFEPAIQSKAKALVETEKKVNHGV